MVAGALKRVAARLPASWQHELRRWFFRRQIRRGVFASGEREYAMLGEMLRLGDWALDIGANVGHYTLRMSELVGPAGRVVALEPVPETFALLAANVRLCAHANVSLLNVAASDRAARVDIQIPSFDIGMTNYYQARITEGSGQLGVLALPVDALGLPAAVRLAKIDVEGHELAVLRGMRELIGRDRPFLVVESSGEEASGLLRGLGYAVSRLGASSNLVCRPA